MMDDVELWELASRAPAAGRPEVVARLAADAAQAERVAALLAQPAPAAGERARYEILGLVGAGSQADVYQARRLDLDRLCALKVFRTASDPAVVERVRAEAGLMARVLSPHVVTVFDAGDLGDGRWFIEMALCAEPDVEGPPGAVALGRSLRALVVERGPLAPDDAARLLLPIAEAVAAAHRAGVVHSDVKPENVLVLPASRRAMLADFGIAASVARPAAGAAPVGTLPYLPPERLAGAAPDAAGDVYGLGGTLLFALGGRPPHPDRRPGGEDARGGAPLPVPAGVPRSLAEVVERALAADPAGRPTADELARALDAFLARRPTAWEARRAGRRLALFYQRHRLIVHLATAAVAVAATLGLGLLRTVVAKTGLEGRAAALDAHVTALDADVARLARQRAGLEGELSRLREEREALAGAEAREREARLRAEGRGGEAAAQLLLAQATAREEAARAERSGAALAAAEAALAEAQGRVRTLEADGAQREAEARAAAERWRLSLEALRAGGEADAARLRAEVQRERDAAAALRDRAADAERQRAAALVAQAEAAARLEGRLDACRAERDEARRALEAARGEAKLSSAPAPAPGARR